ncbi:hypothetical protein SAMN05421736_101933 [Evansella caseinilytica]|uniref:Uncharacterized protein n=1 Tax=Evansella caseinilytica TaxID=1503961 RepID=A0A1H3IUP7_9BACI|nr:hypothetical protein [Evansella caseinilytica]SDY31410.1 hypothetical protein SAMN05421736_101933 [Evansella caseinilytica]
MKQALLPKNFIRKLAKYGFVMNDFQPLVKRVRNGAYTPFLTVFSPCFIRCSWYRETIVLLNQPGWKHQSRRLANERGGMNFYKKYHLNPASVYPDNPLICITILNTKSDS